MIQGQEVEVETIEFRQLEIEFNLVTASDLSTRGIDHIKSDGHSRLIAIDNKIGRLYFAIENAIGWTDISHSLAQCKVEDNKYSLKDKEQVIQLFCHEDFLIIATTERVLKLSMDGNEMKLIAEVSISVKNFVIIDEQIYALLQNLTIEKFDLRTLKRMNDNPYTEKYTALCTDGHKIYFATTDGIIKDSKGKEYGDISDVSTLHCTSDGVIIATKEHDVFIYHSGEWTIFTNPTRASNAGVVDIETITGWHPDLSLLIIVSDSASPELAIIGIIKDTLSLFVLSVEDALPQFPLSSIDPNCDCCPVSLALDFTNPQNTITNDEVNLPPMPIIWSLTTDGTLVPFRIIRRGLDETKMFSLMNPLKSESSLELEDEIEDVQTISNVPSIQKHSFQVIENIQLETPTKKEPEIIPITVDLGGIQNLIIQEFMKVHGWMEQDLQKLRLLSNENKELLRQIQEETMRLLKTRSIGDEPCKLIEEDLMITKELAVFDDAWLSRVQETFKHLHLTHGRLQTLLDASLDVDLESQLQSITLQDVTEIRLLDHNSSLADIQSRLEQLRSIAGQLNTRLDRLQGRFTSKNSKQAPIRTVSHNSRDLLKMKLLKRPAKITTVSDATIVPDTSLHRFEHQGDLLTIRNMLTTRNSATLTNMQAGEVTAVVEALPKQDNLIFKYTDATPKSQPSQIVTERPSVTSSTKPLYGAPSSSSQFLVEKTTIEIPSKPTIEIPSKFESSTPSTSSIKSSEATSREPLLPKAVTSIFHLAPPPSTSSALSFSSESTTLKSVSTPQTSKDSQESTTFDVPGLDENAKVAAEEHKTKSTMYLDSTPPIPKLFTMLKMRDKEEAYKDVSHEVVEDKKTEPLIIPTKDSTLEESSKPEEQQHTTKDDLQEKDMTFIDTSLDTIITQSIEDKLIDKTAPPTQESDSISTSFDSEMMAKDVDNSLGKLGKPLEEIQGTVKTVFGMTQAKQSVSQSSIPSFGNQSFTIGTSSFGQSFPSANLGASLPPHQPVFNPPPLEQQSSHPSFGQHSFGQTSFTPFAALNPNLSIQGNTFASYSTSSNAFANLAQQSSQPQSDEKEEDDEKKSSSLPSSFTTFRD